MSRSSQVLSQSLSLSLSLAALVSLSGCSIEQMAVDSMVPLLEKTRDDFNRTRVVAYAERSGPGLIALLNGLVHGSPENPDLRLLQAELNFSYAFAFLEQSDPAWAIEMYQRAEHAALIALADADEDLAAALPKASPADLASLLAEHCACATSSVCLNSAPGDLDVLPGVFWWAFARGAEVNLRRGEPGEVADLPRVEVAMDWVLRHEPGFFDGGPHLFFGMRYLSLPKSLGGEPEKGLLHFQKVNELTKGKNLLVAVLEAQFYAPTLAAAPAGATLAQVKAAQQRAWDAYYGGLVKVLEAPDDLWPERGVFNALAKARAKVLLADPEANNVIPPEGAQNPYGQGGDAGGWGDDADAGDEGGWGD